MGISIVARLLRLLNLDPDDDHHRRPGPTRKAPATMIPTTLCLLATAILAGAVLVTPQEARALQIRKGLALAGTGEAGAHAKRETTRWRMQDDGRDGWVLLNEDDEEGDSKKGQIKLVPVTLGVMSRCPDAICGSELGSLGAPQLMRSQCARGRSTRCCRRSATKST